MNPLPAIGPLGEDLYILAFLRDSSRRKAPDDEVDEDDHLLAVCVDAAGDIMTFGASDCSIRVDAAGLQFPVREPAGASR